MTLLSGQALIWSFIFCFVIMTCWAMLMVEMVNPIIQAQRVPVARWRGCPSRMEIREKGLATKGWFTYFCTRFGHTNA